MRLNYNDEHMQTVEVLGIKCEFNDMRIDRDSIPEGTFMYEVADGDSDGIPARIQRGIMVNFYGTLICQQELPLGETGTLYIERGDFVYV